MKDWILKGLIEEDRGLSLACYSHQTLGSHEMRAANSPPWRDQPMKFALTALVTIFTTFSTSAVPDDCVNHHLRPHRTLQGGQGSSHFRFNQTCIHLLSPPVDSTCNFTLGLFINYCASGQQQSATPRASDSRPSGSRSRDASVTISADLPNLRTPSRLWPLVFLCAVSQSLGVWRPAIGLALALGLPEASASELVHHTRSPHCLLICP